MSNQIIPQYVCHRKNGMDSHETRIHYAHDISLSLPESVVSPGIALAISAMAFPSSCIRDIVGADVGINVGADVGINVGADVEEDVDHYLIAGKGWNSL